jgi:hypothetical protein
LSYIDSNLNRNVFPYFDDLTDLAEYYQILYRPGFSVQARELTQSSSMSQLQLSRFADNIFTNGSMIRPGQISLNTRYNFIKLQPKYSGIIIDQSYLTSFLYDQNGNKEIIGQTSGIRARVVNFAVADADNAPTLYVVYSTSGTDNSTRTFADNENITVDGDINPTAITAANTSTGLGAAAAIEDGIYYINGYFAVVRAQTLILDRYTNAPTYRVGLQVNESFVTPEQDSSLLDNAQGYSNFTAPGAHRYKISLILSKLALDDVNDKNFIELLRIQNGNIQKKVDNTTYSDIEKTWARRTQDINGSFTIKPFQYELREHRNNNRGDWKQSTVYLAGDIVNKTSITYVAEITGTSGLAGPSQTSGSATDGTTRWRQTSAPIYNRGLFDALEGNGIGDDSKLVISMEPGKAYVEGYEINKIATEYVILDKARDFSQITSGKVTATIGNFIRITNLVSLPQIDENHQVQLYDQLTASPGVPAGGQIGTANVRGIEYESGTIGTATAIYKLFLFNIQINTGKTFSGQCKQIYYDNGFTVKFSADIAGDNLTLTGVITTTGTAVIGIDTKFNTELVVGDYINVAGQDKRVTVITDDNHLTIASGLTSNVTSVTFNIKLVSILEPENTKSLFRFNNSIIRKVRAADDSTIATTYTVYRPFSGTSDNSGNLSFNLTAPGESFGSIALPDNYTIARKDTGAIYTGTVVVSGQTSVTISGLTANKQYYALIAVNKSLDSAKERTKTLSGLITQDYATAVSATAPTLSLKQADISQLISVQMKAGSFTAIMPGDTLVDISNNYTLDNGQRLTHYDIGAIKLKSGSPVPTGSIRISFYYFIHSTGDYFSVDSYSGTVDYKSIPIINPVSDSAINWLDFRPKATWDDTNKISYFDTGSIYPELPKRGIDVQVDYSFYIGRQSKIALDPSGSFFVIDGSSAVRALEPKDPTRGMVLYKIALSPFTFNTNSSNVNITFIDNKRYTMRDIGKLEQRISNIEYYTSLNLLEQQTSTQSILDEDGLNRYKNGFIVDQFTGHGVGDSYALDYRCSIDMINNEMRPLYAFKNINLLEKNTSNSQRTADGYQITGDVITLPYTHIAFINQGYASKTENVNPFAIFTFNGNLDLNPSSDDWFDESQVPDIINNVDGNFNTIASGINNQGSLGTVWGQWQTQWTGAELQIGGINFAAFPIDPQSGEINLDQATPEQLAIYNNTIGLFPPGQGPYMFAKTSTQVFVPATIQSVVDTTSTSSSKVLSQAVIPYIRARDLLFVARAMKPNTIVYPYFDSIAIGSYVSPATRVQITNINGSFDSNTNVGALAKSDQARQDSSNNSITCLNRGDVIKGNTSNATAVVALIELDRNGNRFLHLVNIKGTFTAAETIVGTVSGATATIGTVTPTNILITNDHGEIAGIFHIPNTDAIRFRTGVKEFRLTDLPNGLTNFTTIANIQYEASGTLETTQKTITTTRTIRLIQNISQNSGTIINQTFPPAPTTNPPSGGGSTIVGFIPGQGFIFQQPGDVTQNPTFTPPGSAIIQPVGTETGAQPISGTINDGVGGTLTGFTPGVGFNFASYGVDPLAESFKINKDGGLFLTQVDLYFYSKDQTIPLTIDIREMINGYPGPAVLPFSTVTLNPDQINISSDASAATTFRFVSPVYAANNTEYCLVIRSDSNSYKMWVAGLGEVDITTNRTISAQPYAGVLFKSQNASTWNADQLEDLKFTLYAADFDISRVGKVSLINDQVPAITLSTNPFNTVSGSNIIRVNHYNHGMDNNSWVSISGSGGLVNGIDSIYINGLHQITNVQFHSYTITIVDGAGAAQNATGTGPAGSTGIMATENARYDSLQPMIQLNDFSETFASINHTGTSFGTYVLDSTATTIIPNETHRFDDISRVIASQVNENKFLSKNSLGLVANLVSTNSSLSPFLDTHRMSLITITNLTNTNPVSNNVSGYDDRAVSSANINIAFSGTTISTVDTATKLQFKTLVPGKLITVSGAVNAGNNSTFTIITVAQDGSNFTVDTNLVTEVAGNAVSIIEHEQHVSEIAITGGTSASKYLTRRINLQNESSFAKIQFSINQPTNTSVDVYYRAGNKDNFDQAIYVLAQPDTTIPTINNFNQFSEISYSISDIPSFTSISIKIVPKSTSTVNVIRIKELSVICCP